MEATTTVVNHTGSAWIDKLLPAWLRVQDAHVEAYGTEASAWITSEESNTAMLAAAVSNVGSVWLWEDYIQRENGEPSYVDLWVVDEDAGRIQIEAEIRDVFVDKPRTLVNANKGLDKALAAARSILESTREPTRYGIVYLRLCFNTGTVEDIDESGEERIAEAVEAVIKEGGNDDSFAVAYVLPRPRWVTPYFGYVCPGIAVLGRLA